MDVLFPISLFRLSPGLKMSFQHNSVRKNFFLSACFCWDSKISLCEIDLKFEFGGLIGYGNFCLDSVFCPNYLDYMQHSMMLLEQFDHILAKDLATAT